MSPASRGRPAVTDTEAIARVALRLFASRGFDETSMDDIAKAAGIGRSTLFTYFPSKGSILWNHFDEASLEFRGVLAALPAGTPLADGAFAACGHLLERLAQERPLAEVLRVIATAPPRSTGMWDAYDRWGGYVAEYVAARRGGEPGDFESQALGMLIWSTMWTAMAHWARSGEPSPMPYFRRALALVDESSLTAAR